MTTVRIALTGLGLITGAGNDVEKAWSSITQGISGIRMNTLFDASELRTTWAGQVTAPQPEEPDRCYSLAATAIQEALGNSGLDLDTVDRDRVAVVVGSSLGAMPTLEGVHRELVHEGRLDAGRAAASQLHCVGDYIAAEFDLRGPRVVLSNACAASAVALGYAAELLWKGDADYVICGGVDPLASLSSYGFSSLGALDPEPCAPMTASTGLTLGEGAGFMVLEPADRAAARGARALAELGGYGLSCDGYHQTAPDPSGKGAAAAMAEALATAGLETGDVDYLNLHGTGTPTNDGSEPKAVKRLFGSSIPRPAPPSRSSATPSALPGRWRRSSAPWRSSAAPCHRPSTPRGGPRRSGWTSCPTSAGLPSPAWCCPTPSPSAATTRRLCSTGWAGRARRRDVPRRSGVSW